MKKSILTYKFRIKDSSHRNLLNKKARAVNFVWNYCNEVSKKSADRRSAGGGKSWISEFDLNRLMAGSSKELGLLSCTNYAISRVFIAKRNAYKKPSLKWRSYKRNLGWIPFQALGIQLKGDSVTYLGRKYKFWKSSEIKGKLKTGSFNQDAEGKWYINLNCEIEPQPKTKGQGIIGIDLGLKTLATCSDGKIIENPKVLSKYAERLAKAQRAKKKKRVTKTYAKIKNVRKDYLQKATTKLARENKQIFVGDVNALKLVKTKMAKSILDAGWGLFKSMLAYKALKLGIDFQITNEKYSTVTCSHCLQKTGPSGLSALGVREWECSSCGSQHQRDVNAAKNILIFALGHESPSGESTVSLSSGGCHGH